MTEPKNPELNAHRRARYQNDPAYAASIRNSRRDRYREQRGVKIRHCALTIEEVRNAGTKRPMASGKTEITLSSEELAKLMGYHYSTMIRWQHGGLFPKPRQPIDKREDICMYSVREAKELVRIMACHQETHQGLYAKDLTTISRLFAVMG
jgi:hypothetical protein